MGDGEVAEFGPVPAELVEFEFGIELEFPAEFELPFFAALEEFAFALFELFDELLFPDFDLLLVFAVKTEFSRADEFLLF